MLLSSITFIETIALAVLLGIAMLLLKRINISYNAKIWIMVIMVLIFILLGIFGAEDIATIQRYKVFQWLFTLISNLF